MNNREMLGLLDTYYRLSVLKHKERSGWVEWNVIARRLESVAEHVFSVQQLAWLIYSEAELDLDIEHVISMLSLHETEEVKIGDITPFDGVSEDEKLRIGNEAVDELWGNLKRKNKMISLIDEFNERKTKEAKFAYLCDKLDCDLQAKKYSDEGRCTIGCAPKGLIDNPDIRKLILESGAKNVSDVFIAHDEGKYHGTVFAEIVQFLKEYNSKDKG